MLSPRNIITTTIVIAVISIIAAVASLMGDPDSDGLAGDSYGTRANGHRAIFETFEELKIPVERSFQPPTSELSKETTLIFWAPYPRLVTIEPTYLQDIKNWIREGGRVVVGMPTNDVVSFSQPLIETESALDLLGIKGVQTKLVFERETERAEPDEVDSEDVFEMLFGTELEREQHEIETTGTMNRLDGIVETIDVPKYQVQVLQLNGESKPTGTVSIGESERHTVAASFRLGQGEVVVVSDPALAHNRSIASADNAALILNLAVRPTTDSKPAIVFDEFYHGLTIRGNPLWLMTRQGFGTMTLALMLACGLFVWRKATFLGPPLSSKASSRRSIDEYIQAMSRLLSRAQASEMFLIREVREGVLREIRNQLGLAPGKDNQEVVCTALARRDAGAAAKLSEAIDALDALLARSQTLSNKQIVQALQKVTDCL